MKMFLLGALSMYLISCIVAIILDETRLVDIWDFGEYYFHLPFLPITLAYLLIKHLPIMIHDSISLMRLGFNPVGKFMQFDDADTEILKQVIETTYNRAIHRYCQIIIKKENRTVKGGK